MPVPEWDAVVFNSTDNEYLAVVEYDCLDGYAFEDELKEVEISERPKYTSKPRQAYCSKSKDWIEPLGNCVRK